MCMPHITWYFCLELFYEILSAKVDTTILSRHIIHILPFIVAIICCICNYYTIPILLYYTYTVFHYFRSLYLWSSPVKSVICSGVRLLLDAKLWVFEIEEQLTHNWANFNTIRTQPRLFEHLHQKMNFKHPEVCGSPKFPWPQFACVVSHARNKVWSKADIRLEQMNQISNTARCKNYSLFQLWTASGIRSWSIYLQSWNTLRMETADLPML